MKNTSLKLYYTSVIILFFIAGCQPSDMRQGDNVGDRLILDKSESSSDIKNVIFVLSDDHRYDFMGFTGKVPWLKTPAMDKMAAEGCHLENAFVTTSLCSPSRASILTGMYSHTHTVVDNQAPVPEDLIFFPQYINLFKHI